MVLLATLVVLLDQVINLALLHLRHLLLQLLLQFTQDLALSKALTDASHATHVLGVLLSSDKVELVLLFALGLQVLLVFEGLEDVFQVDLRRRGRLRACGLVPEGLHLLEVLVQLVISTVDVGLFSGGFAA